MITVPHIPTFLLVVLRKTDTDKPHKQEELQQNAGICSGIVFQRVLHCVYAYVSVKWICVTWKREITFEHFL